MLGANLRQLSSNAVSISALCRDLGINRTQYNRYLAGESFPRPDVLHRICSYFGVDARILLEPVEQIHSPQAGLFEHPEVADFVGHSADTLSEEHFPSGFYRFVRRSFLHDDQFVQGLTYAYRKDGHTFLRGFEAKQAMAEQGLPTAPAQREFRAVVMPQEDGVALLVSRRGAATATFNYMARVPSFENNFWVGYATRTVREDVAGRRVERQVMEHLGRNTHKVLAAARSVGFCSTDQLLPYLRQMLKSGVPFT
ncbi:helix-turn-helix domain-containing protein [Tropicibacter oceani]|uniref:Helix-turn-helix transcriptional regulator n=1 Tax=Tropicibacter oceani TaxID=3058420 RepID=A0ABY8QDK2_9RHOB|nr:helix-turn-helix transcriptional regulator [Tropicibacter oceani]WGW02705.1 helix-turn-helix transcriptional regulator [Tropicibacter oceani]